MALVAKEVLKIGFTVAALPGNVVSPEAVEKYGWQDQVEDDGRADAATVDPHAADADRPAGS